MTKTGMLKELAQAALDGGWKPVESLHKSCFIEVYACSDMVRIAYYRNDCKPYFAEQLIKEYCIEQFILNREAMESIFPHKISYCCDYIYLCDKRRGPVECEIMLNGTPYNGCNKHRTVKLNVAIGIVRESSIIMYNGGDPIEYLYKMMKETKDESRK